MSYYLVPGGTLKAIPSRSHMKGRLVSPLPALAATDGPPHLARLQVTMFSTLSYDLTRCGNR